ncbi:MAG: hypothetical protein PUG15_07745 [Bacteroidales bacterium]|nr:hypothetical protein [Bacteroidales bacterium]
MFVSILNRKNALRLNGFRFLTILNSILFTLASQGGNLPTLWAIGDGAFAAFLHKNKLWDENEIVPPFQGYGVCRIVSQGLPPCLNYSVLSALTIPKG